MINWFTKLFKDEEVRSEQSTDVTDYGVLDFMVELIPDKSRIAKEVAALPRLKNLPTENQRTLVPEFFRLFEAIITETQTKEDLYEKLRSNFDVDSLNKMRVPELLEGEARNISQLEITASVAAKNAMSRVGREHTEQFIEEKTKDSLLSGVFIDSIGNIDFTIAESKFYKLPSQWLKLIERSLRELISGLDSIVSLEPYQPIPIDSRSNTGLEQYDQEKLQNAFSGVGLAEFIEQGAMRDVSAIMRGKSGEVIPTALSGSVIKDERGLVSAIVIAAKDLRQLQEYAKQKLSSITPILQKVASGDFSENIVIPKNKDEFTDHMTVLNSVLKDFKGMVDEIEKKSEELEAQNEELEEASAELEEAKTGLENKVHERTEELEKAKTGLEEQVAARTKELQELNKNLEDEVSKRTEELQDKLLELERFNKIAVGRELKMVELKEEVARLKGSGQ